MIKKLRWILYSLDNDLTLYEFISNVFVRTHSFKSVFSPHPPHHLKPHLLPLLSSHHFQIQFKTPPATKSQMASRSTHLLLLLLLFQCLASAISAAVPAIYMFGDSLADVGNNDYLKLTVLKADFPHNGVDYPGGKATGRFSNGKNSADFLGM